MSTDLKKYVAIRYNTATGFMPSQWNGHGRANLDPVWLVERLALFDTYCAPSLEGQSQKDFTVLIAFDSEHMRTTSGSSAPARPGLMSGRFSSRPARTTMSPSMRLSKATRMPNLFR
ncbi:hypothetical protein EN925_27080 [Mesorhizobium sp. M7A.F.Ca.US.006.04.2.1]|uniref:glycosyltransferase n=1 Tax=unclassified Mesorhizobium TaxID=325217 RepID=UPI000FCC7866|nr:MULTISPECIES: glycosyltransferase [unclassified Mesorhizobium]RUY15733.1 hypothetical protein EN991_13820 [Mesorhizobium sp. M7A.F.Ca.US.005.03.2.1]RUY29018.1 hypothetical protein EN979_11435 [Mesorhizobium sp. M7A.F.Ca.US.001.04.2.1]RUY43964.1 hypothetical protein EN978_07730 [Mesorhizobium sp. M7A.F.Ca.US.001.04.1.1]RVA02821.1 hypothetical protein EN938_18090 [Mesorhizobium sp. M7A.F.Ca.US.001.02.1.1]RVA15269.1 hypothetical protein EN932_01815 [Mesorhizobium sp. M7A.F.Ca.US.002.01.1.1]